MKGAAGGGLNPKMSKEPITREKFLHDSKVAGGFLESPDERTFADLFQTFTPQLIAFFRTRNCDLVVAEDLAQEVMLTVYFKASQLRDRTLFHAWLFKIARNALCRHYGKRSREVETIDLSGIADRMIAGAQKPAGSLAFEFRHWMAFLDSRERDVMMLRFVEEWEYHEIAAAREIPIGTVQWRVFNAKKKLAPYLATRLNIACEAA